MEQAYKRAMAQFDAQEAGSLDKMCRIKTLLILYKSKYGRAILDGAFHLLPPCRFSTATYNDVLGDHRMITPDANGAVRGAQLVEWCDEFMVSHSQDEPLDNALILAEIFSRGRC